MGRNLRSLPAFFSAPKYFSCIHSQTVTDQFPDLKRRFTRILRTAVYLILILNVLFLLPHKGWSQKRQLTASNKAVKIGYIDHSTVRKQFIAFAAAKERIAKEHLAEKRSLEQSIQLLNQQTKEQLRLDSLSGGQNQLQILNAADAKKSQLQSSFKDAQKRRHEERNILMQNYEKKIVSAIDAVISEGGFTEIKPFDPNATGQRGINITDLVLKKLN